MGRRPKSDTQGVNGNAPVTKKAKNYIDKKEFYDEICECRKTETLSPKLINMFVKLCTNLASLKPYVNEDDKKDCVATAIEKCVKYWMKFDPEKSNNPFAYFTTVATFGLAAGWKELGKGRAPAGTGLRISDTTYTLN